MLPQFSLCPLSPHHIPCGSSLSARLCVTTLWLLSTFRQRYAPTAIHVLAYREPFRMSAPGTAFHRRGIAMALVVLLLLIVLCQLPTRSSFLFLRLLLLLLLLNATLCSAHHRTYTSNGNINSTKRRAKTN